MCEIRQSIRWQQLGMKRGIFFDFDSTITTPIKVVRFQRHAVADRPEIFASMTAEEIEANFGGRPRIVRLAELFGSLVDAGAELFIVSIGFRDSCIIPHLRAVGLAKFFNEDNIYGQDSEALRCRDFAKACLIASLMAQRGWEPHDALFVDDSARHVEGAVGVCEVLKVGGRGLTGAELEAIGVICREGHAAALGARARPAAAPGRGPAWRLQAEEGVPQAAVAVGAWRVAELPAEKARATGGASPLAEQRRHADRSPPSSRQKALDASPAAASRHADASPGTAPRRTLTASPTTRRAADVATPRRRSAASPPPGAPRRTSPQASPPGRRACEASPPARRGTAPARTPDASPAGVRGAAEAPARAPAAPRRRSLLAVEPAR